MGLRPLYCPWPRFVDGAPPSAAFALRPLCVARDLERCDHISPRWGGHTLCQGQLKGPVLGAPAPIMGSELLHKTPSRSSDSSLCPAPMPQGVSYVRSQPKDVHETAASVIDVARSFVSLHIHSTLQYVDLYHAA